MMKGEWKRAICVYEIATVEHFAPDRKKRSVYAHVLFVGVLEWRDTDTRFTETRILSAKLLLRGLKTYNIYLIKAKSSYIPVLLLFLV